MIIQLFDLIFLTGVGICLFRTIFYPIKNRNQNSIYKIYIALLSDLFIYALLLFVEWSSIAERLDNIEDISGALLPALWAFVFYAFIQENAREQLLVSEDKFASIVRHSPFCIAIGDSRLESFTLANETFMLTFGVEDNAVRNNSFPSGFIWNSEQQQQQLIQNISTHTYWHEPYLELLTSSGASLITDARFNRITIGQQQQILVTFNDISHQVQSAQEKQEMQLMLQQLTDTIPEILFLADITSKKLIYANHAAKKIIGVEFNKRSSVDYNNLLINMIPDDEKKRLHITPGWLYRPTPINEELRFTRADGTAIWIQIKTTPVYNNSGEAYRVVGIVNDITMRKNAATKEKLHQQQLQQADKMASLGILVSGMAHEINNPNNFIMLNTPIIREIWNDARPVLDKHYSKNSDFTLSNVTYPEIRDTVPKLIDGIEHGSNRIMKIVNNLKEYARMDISPFDKQFDVQDAVKDAVMLTNNMIKKATRRFSVHYRNSPVPVIGNSQKLEQVLINLIQNSCQSLTAIDQAITISITLEGNHCKISVNDEGIGISENDIKHITDPFFTRKRSQGGTGLGLSISAGIINEHNGTLSFVSNIEKGTTATITLPLATMKNRNDNQINPDS